MKPSKPLAKQPTQLCEALAVQRTFMPQVALLKLGHAESRMPGADQMAHDPRVCEVSGWIFEDNLARVVEYMAMLVRYEWSDLDDGALAAGIASTDADLPLSTWFEYPVAGTPDLVLWIARDHGGGILSVIISGEFDAVLAARFETLLDLH